MPERQDRQGELKSGRGCHDEQRRVAEAADDAKRQQESRERRVWGRIGDESEARCGLKLAEFRCDTVSDELIARRAFL